LLCPVHGAKITMNQCLKNHLLLILSTNMDKIVDKLLSYCTININLYMKVLFLLENLLANGLRESDHYDGT
jgi:hypothetical protein